MLLMAERRNRLAHGMAQQHLDLLRQLPITVDLDALSQSWGETLAIARSERLTVYDAAYLELALRKRLPLATKDRPLAEAATRCGVDTILI